MRIINFDDGFTSAVAPVVEMAASSVSVTPTGNLASTDVQAALVELQGDSDTYAAHVANTSNPHSVTKTQVGLSAVTNDAQVKRTEMGAVSGVATLDSGGTVPMGQMPAAILGANIYQGTWDANTNTPTLASGVGTKGWFYYVSADGSTSLNGISDWKISDMVIYSGTAWEKIDNTDAVASVAGRTGVVTLSSTDVGLANVDNTSDATKNAASVTLTNKVLSDTTTFFGAVADLTKKFKVLLSSATTGKTMTLLSAHTNDRTITLPDSTGTLSTLAGTEALTNKDYQGGTASNTSRLTVPSAALATLTGLTRKQGTLVYDTTANALLADDGANLNQIGGGSGEKNYITSPSTATGWTASGAGITVATDSTGADLPRPNTSKTGILLTGVSGSSAYAYFRFILDDADAGKKLKIQFDMKPGTAVASDFRVDVYSNTANDYTTGNTRLALSTDVSAVAALPALTGTYRAAFDCPAISAKYIEVRVGLNTTQTHTLVISDVIVGPGTIVQGAAVGPEVSWTPTVVGCGAATVNRAVYAQVGEYIEGSVEFTCGTPTGVNATLTLPNSWTTVATAGANPLAGQWGSNNTSATTVKTGGIILDAAGGNFVYFSNGEYTPTAAMNAAAFGNALFAGSATVSLRFRCRINQLVGSGAVNVVQNDAEYVYNTATADSSDTTSFGYGPGGQQFGSFGTASRSKRVRFLSPVQATDRVEVEVWDSSAATGFMPISMIGGYISTTATTGISLEPVNSTDFDVIFGSAGYGASTVRAAGAWSVIAASANFKWRVRKVSGGAAIGFSNVAQSTSGLVKSAGQLQGTNTNDDAATGFVGEYIQNYRSSNLAVTTGTWFSIDSGNASFNDGNETGVVLTAGDWDVQGSVFCVGATGTTGSQAQIGIGTAKGTGTTGIPGDGSADAIVFGSMTAPMRLGFNTPQFRITVANGATKTIYLKANIVFAVSTLNITGILRARRVR